MFSTLFLFGIGLAASINTLSGVAAAAVCKDYVVLSARGTFDPPGPEYNLKQIVATTLNNLPNGAAVDVDYPAQASVASTQAGVSWVRRYLQEANQACPQQKYALLGFSQGAMVMAEAAGGFASAGDPVYDAIKVVFMAGNPFHVPNRVGNVDEQGGHSTAAAPGTAMKDDPNPAELDRFAADGKVMDVCLAADPICNSAHHGSSAHGSYGGSQNVQAMAARFVVSKLTG
ncbi:hypothetical protein A4X13_0g9041 [Tilletia indica]|uniref:Cutinase n=1 Tax=Tilletia indica TaxID=43049 RepID=A0A8T8SBP7_9BASI|nr:hypothetical protein A4X13_0g9041 [Tilletia indica]